MCYCANCFVCFFIICKSCIYKTIGFVEKLSENVYLQCIRDYVKSKINETAVSIYSRMSDLCSENLIYLEVRS